MINLAMFPPVMSCPFPDIPRQHRCDDRRTEDHMRAANTPSPKSLKNVLLKTTSNNITFKEFVSFTACYGAVVASNAEVAVGSKRNTWNNNGLEI